MSSPLQSHSANQPPERLSSHQSPEKLSSNRLFTIHPPHRHPSNYSSNPNRSLLAMATRVAMTHVASVTDLADMPWDLAEPILKRIDNPDQLRQIQAASPHLADKTAELWKAFIRRDCPSLAGAFLEPKNPPSWWKVHRHYVKEETSLKLSQEDALRRAYEDVVAAKVHTGRIETPRPMPIEHSMRAGQTDIIQYGPRAGKMYTSRVATTAATRAVAPAVSSTGRFRGSGVVKSGNAPTAAGKAVLAKIRAQSAKKVQLVRQAQSHIQQRATSISPRPRPRPAQAPKPPVEMTSRPAEVETAPAPKSTPAPAPAPTTTPSSPPLALVTGTDGRTTVAPAPAPAVRTRPAGHPSIFMPAKKRKV